jgi:TniQ protein
MVPVFQVYPVCQVKRPQLALPSRLYSLEPIGLSTPYVESLTGYIIRLAQEHDLSVQDLVVRQILPMYGRAGNSRADYNWTNGFWIGDSVLVNGLGVIADTWKKMIEELTLRQDIGHMTMLLWKNVIAGKSKLGFLHQRRKWCVVCYHEWQSSKKPIYEPIIWSLSVVTTCPRHGTLLSSECGHCGQNSSPLCQFSRPGYCSKCGYWLGSPRNFLNDQSEGERQWQDWVVKSIGDMISLMPNLINEPIEEGFAKSITSYCKYAGKGGKAEISRRMNIKIESTLKLQNKINRPSLITAMRLSYFLKISLLEIFTNPLIDQVIETRFVSGDISSIELKNQSKKLLDKWQIEIIRNEFEIELSKDASNTSSIKDIAKRLGHATNTLRRHAGDLVKQLLEHQRKVFELNSVQEALNIFLQEMPPPSVKAVVERLGLKDTSLLRLHFSDTTHAIAQRRKDYRRNQRDMRVLQTCEKIREITFFLHTEGVNPSKQVVSDRLGWRSPGMMRTPEFLQAWRDARRDLGISIENLSD